MQVERTKKSMFLFEEQLLQQQTQSLIEQDQQLLKKLLSRCGKVYQKELSRNHSISTFLKNYKSIMKAHSSALANVMSVNICIHFALLCSQGMLKENRQNEAKILLKQATEYCQIQGTDSMLLAVSFNNLAHLYYKQGKLYKALAVGLQAIDLVQDYIQAARFVLPRQRLTEDVVVFVNILSIVHKTLSKILKIKDKDDFRVLLKNVNKLGYAYSLKYLGKDSIFTKKFFMPQNSIILPVYQELDYSQVRPFSPSNFEMKLADQLESIYKKLAQLNHQPQVYYIRENIIKSKQSILTSVIAVQVPESVEQQPLVEYQVHYCSKFIVNNHEITISILRDFNELIVESNSYQNFNGHLELKANINGLEVIQRIHQEKFEKIKQCLKVIDFLPFQLQLEKMNSSQFFRRVLINFLAVSNRKIQIFPRSIGVLDPFQTNFCGQKVLIFVNHVCFNKFRIALCPPSTCETLYLNLYLNQKESYLQLTQIQNEKIRSISAKYNQNNQANLTFFGAAKKITVFERKKFQTRIQEILAEFESFIQQVESQMTTQITSISNLGDQEPFYLCSQDKQNKRMFLQLKYRSNVNHVEVYLQNTYKTHSPNGVTQSKGSSIYAPDHFIRDFSFGIRNAHNNLTPFFNIIAQKFSLKTYNQPMEEYEFDRFEQNAIQEVQLNSKFFKRKFIQFEDYRLPVTLQLITLKNQKPLGIRVSAYEPIKCVQTGVFIYLIPEYWQTYQTQPIQSKEVKQNQLQNFDNSNANNQFEFHRNYFLTNWLKQQGFDLIFSKIVVVNRGLELRGINRKFCSLEEII